MLGVELRAGGVVITVANVYIKPGCAHKSRSFLDGVLGSGFDIVLGDFNDKSGRWTLSATNRNPSYRLQLRPSPSFHGPHGDSHLDLVLFRQQLDLVPQCVQQLSEFAKSAHDILVWRFERDFLLRRRLRVDPIRVCVSSRERFISFLYAGMPYSLALTLPFSPLPIPLSLEMHSDDFRLLSQPN